MKSCTTTEAVASTSATTTIVAESELYLLSSTSTTATEICEPAPVPDLVGDAFWFDGGMYFDGTSRLEMPGTAEMFEDGPFTVYVEWRPIDEINNRQQIIGHYNWELFQNSNNVRYQLGRINNASGTAHSIDHPIKNDFFDKKNTALFLYNPSTNNFSNGYMRLYLNNKFVNQVNLGTNIIWKEYGKEFLTFGKSFHGDSNYSTFVLYKAYIVNNNSQKSSERFKISDSPDSRTEVTIFTNTMKELTDIRIDVKN